MFASSCALGRDAGQSAPDELSAGKGVMVCIHGHVPTGSEYLGSRCTIRLRFRSGIRVLGRYVVNARGIARLQEQERGGNPCDAMCRRGMLGLVLPALSDGISVLNEGIGLATASLFWAHASYVGDAPIHAQMSLSDQQQALAKRDMSESIT
jgi:hypothetical protein